MNRAGNRIAMLVCAAAIGASWSAAAQAHDFYAGKTLVISVGSAPGGSYDAYARVVARHFGRLIPGQPSIVVKNMPGAAGLKAAQYLFAIAPKDGTEIGALLNNAPVTELMEPGKHGFDPARFLWIGSVASPANVLAVWHTTGVKTIEDAKAKEVTIGSTTPGTTKEMFPLMANRLLGTKFKVINGYKGGAEINMAMERGEVGGHGANSWVSFQFQNAEWVRDHKINNIFQVTFQRDPALPDVPTLMELAKNDEQRKIILILTTGEAIGRPLAAPPGVADAQVALLRRAFDATMKDAGFLADADKAKLEIGPTSGERLQAMVAEMMASPPDIVEKYKKAVASQQ
jgi:tripartite-type tricarboxylate transporter receptor subunit TctC